MKSNRFLEVMTAILLLSMAAAGWAAPLQTPYGLAVNPNSGALYIADPSAGKVLVAQPGARAGTAFVASLNPFTLAVDKNGLVYVGRVGANGKIDVFNTGGAFISTLPVADSATAMTIDSNNVLYQANGFPGQTILTVHVYSNDLSPPYQQLAAAGTVPYYREFQTVTYLVPGKHYALAYDNGQILIVGGDHIEPGTIYIPNIYDASLFFIAVDDPAATIPSIIFRSNRNDVATPWVNAHTLDSPGSVSAATVDGFHNVFYVNPDDRTIMVTAKARLANTLLSNLPSRPWGVALDQARSKLYVSFPDEHLVRAYSVSYATKNGVKVPNQLSAPTIIR